MGLLDSLASILPYAIPAAAGAALGGPGLGMVGAGGAATAKAGALDQQMKLAEMMNEADYRNKDLGLRAQEIQSNEALRKDALHQQAYEQGQNREVRQSEGEANRAARQQAANDANAIRQEVVSQRDQLLALQKQEAATRDQEARDKITEAKNQHVINSVQYAKGKAQEAAEAAWKDAGWRNSPFWGKDHDSFVADFKNKHTLDFLSIQDPKALEDADADPDVIAMAKDRQAANQRAAKLSAPKPATPSAASAKLKPAGRPADPPIPAGARYVRDKTGKAIGHTMDGKTMEPF